MKEYYTFLIIGRGKLALAMAEDLKECSPRYSFSQTIDAREMIFQVRLPALIAVQTSSARRMDLLLENCAAYNTPLVLASTGQDHLLPSQPTFPIIKAPNLIPEILALKSVTPELGRLLKGLGVVVTIEESHQSQKESLAGTANAFARDFGVAAEEVIKVRSPVQQVARYGVPREYLDAHAYHTITMQGPGCEMGIWTKVHGRPYAAGLKLLAPKIYPSGKLIAPGIYEAHDLLFRGTDASKPN